MLIQTNLRFLGLIAVTSDIVNEETNLEIRIMIDEFIHDISKQSLIETSTVVDRLLDIRNITDIVPV